MNNENINVLMKLGMNERQAKVYLALLNQNQATAVELHRMSGVPQTKIYEVMKSMVVGGYCRERKIGRNRAFTAVEPKIALNNLIMDVENLHAEAIELQKRLTAMYDETEDNVDPSEYIEVVHGNDNIHHYYLNLLQTAHHSIQGFGKAPYTSYTREMRKAQETEMLAFVKRGGRSKWVYELNDNSPEWLPDDLTVRINNGVDLKVMKNLPVKMMVFDSQRVFVLKENAMSPGKELSMTAIKQSATAHAYETLFNFIWEQAEEYGGIEDYE